MTVSKISALAFGARSTALAFPPGPVSTVLGSKELPAESRSWRYAPGTGSPVGRVAVTERPTSPFAGTVAEASVIATAIGWALPFQSSAPVAMGAMAGPVTTSPGGRLGCWRFPSIPQAVPSEPTVVATATRGRYQPDGRSVAKATVATTVAGVKVLAVTVETA